MLLSVLNIKTPCQRALHTVCERVTVFEPTGKGKQLTLSKCWTRQCSTYSVFCNSVLSSINSGLESLNRIDAGVGLGQFRTPWCWTILFALLSVLKLGRFARDRVVLNQLSIEVFGLIYFWLTCLKVLDLVKFRPKSRDPTQLWHRAKFVLAIVATWLLM